MTNPFETLKCPHGETAAVCATKNAEKKCTNCPTDQFMGEEKGTCKHFWRLKLADGKNVYGIKV